MKKKIIKLLFASLVGAVALSGLHLDSTLQAADVDTLNTSAINTDGLKVDKTSKANEDGTYTINLESYTTGAVSIIEKAQPLDVVLVLDQSDSMSWKFENGDTRNKSLKETALVFLNDLNANAIENNVDHRVAAVGFASDNAGTGILGTGGTGGIKKDYDYYSLDREKSKYTGQMLSVTKTYNELRDSIASLAMVGETRIDLGYDMAYNLLKYNQTTETNRQKVVIVFTDGEASDIPHIGGGINGRYSASIQKAYAIKNEQNALVYSIASMDPKIDSYVKGKIDGLMNQASSNHKDATMFKEGLDGIEKGYYKIAADTPTMKEIFKQIFEQITQPSIALDSTTTLKDIVSPYFQEAKAENITVYTQDYAGKDAAGNDIWKDKVVASDSLTAKIEGKSVLVSGFDYNANTVTWNNGVAAGKKLVVEINVNKKDGFIGGKDVLTNDPASGIYIGETIVKKFPEPTVDVPITINASANNESIYLGGNISNLEGLFDADVISDGTQFKIGDKVYNFGDNNNDYVDVYYTIKDAEGNVQAEYKVPAGATSGEWVSNTLDTTTLVNNNNYTVEVNVTNKGESKVEVRDAKTSTVFVYKPEITVANQVMFLNENINLNDVVATMVTWTNSDANATKLSTPAPTLTYTFDKVSGTAISNSTDYKPLEDGTYKVNVWNAKTNITSNTTITNTEETATDYNFKIRVLTGSLRIEKRINKGYTDNTAINANQTFVFRIDVRDTMDGEITKTMYQTIDFSANENKLTKSVVLQHLPKGYYTISEESNWSWKYTEDEEGRLDNYAGNKGAEEAQSILIGDNNSINTNGLPYFGTAKDTKLGDKDISLPAEVTFTNNIKETNILGDVANAINNFVTAK